MAAIEMNPATAKLLGLAPEPQPLRDAFLRWQCRIRQMMMRDDRGRPGDAIMPALTLPGATEPMGHIITVLSKGPAHSKTPEMRHMAQRTNDPASIREAALKFFGEFYYQKATEFSDILTATFPPDSPGAAAIRRAERCTVTFDVFNQRYDLDCRGWKLTAKNPLWQSTYWHNRLFNPTLPENTVILGFEPDWKTSTANPSPV
ncbi:MAG: hypothetical protein ACFB03_14070 [Paracoccaceae bacterium]